MASVNKKPFYKFKFKKPPKNSFINTVNLLSLTTLQKQMFADNQWKIMKNQV